MARINSFKPTAGMNPPELIGRDEILDDFIEALENGPGAPDRLLRVSGVRGVGKTVLLNALGDVAREYGFHVVDVAANAGFLRSHSRRPCAESRSVFSVDIAFDSGREPGLRWNIQVGDAAGTGHVRGFVQRRPPYHAR